MLRILNITKLFYPNTVNEKKALSDFSFEIPNQDFVTIVGSNGAGKSTLFQLISGHILPDRGSVILDGRDITYEKEYKRSKEIGHLFQDPMKGTAPHMTIEENLALAYLRNKSKSSLFSRLNKKSRELFYEKLKELNIGLETRMKSPVGLLSGGQRQALTLLMATLVPPKILLLDEHTAALDPATAEKILLLTKQIVSKHRITCLMITHNLVSALEIGNRTIMMDDGKVVLDISGEERERMTVEILLEEFRNNAQKSITDDKLLLS